MNPRTIVDIGSGEVKIYKWNDSIDDFDAKPHHSIQKRLSVSENNITLDGGQGFPSISNL